MQHFWEEPCISGISGSGTIFFSGCNLGCTFCQNYEISNINHPKGVEIQADLLEAEFFRLKNLGCHNISLVTGSHLSFELLPVIKNAKKNGLNLPFVWNSGSYETVSQVKAMDRSIDIYLPDLKFYSSDLSGKIANAPDYFKIAGKAVTEMLLQRPHNFKTNTKRCHDSVTKFQSNPAKENILNDNGIPNDSNIEILQEGVVIRHLVLPGFYQDSIKILEWIEANLSNSVTLSLLSQYIPDYYERGCLDHGVERISSLKRKLTTYEYEKVVNKAISLGFSDVYIQKKESAKNEYVPDF